MRQLAVLLLLTVPALAPLTYPGFFRTHTTFVPVYIVYDLALNFPRFSWNPLGDSGLLAYYIALGFYKLGLSGSDAVKAVHGLGLVLGVLGVYFWCSRWMGWKPALLAAVIYAYLPYNLAVVYIRGAPNEALFFGLFPWLLWSLGLEQGGSRRPLWPLLPQILAALVGGLLALCNPGLALFGLVAAGGWAILRRLWVFPMAMPVAFFGSYRLLASFLPGGKVLPGSEEFFRHFVLPFQLFSAWWSIRPSTPGWIGEMPFQLGVVAMALACFTAIRWVKSPAREAGFCLLLGVSLTLLSLPISSAFWRINGLWRWLGYPWQVLLLAGLGLAGAAGAALAYEKRLTLLPLWASLVALALLGSYRYLEPEFISRQPRQKPLAIIGADNAILVDCTYHGELVPGEAVEMELVWQALKPFDADYTVFVHIVDEGDRKWGQRDQMPQNGKKPTSRWEPGEIISDTYPIEIGEGAPVGSLNLAVGMYRWDTGERLPVRGREDGRAIIPLSVCPSE